MSIDSEHHDMVANLIKPGRAIREDLTDQNADLLHSAVGVAGEAGELLDGIKKAAIYGRNLDVDNVVEELGDLEFYMARIRQVVGVDRNDVLAANMNKLGQRYSSGSYSNAEAIQRADKA